MNCRSYFGDEFAGVFCPGHMAGSVLKANQEVGQDDCQDASRDGYSGADKPFATAGAAFGSCQAMFKHFVDVQVQCPCCFWVEVRELLRILGASVALGDLVLDVREKGRSCGELCLQFLDEGGGWPFQLLSAMDGCVL